MEIEMRRADVVEPVVESDSAAAASWFDKFEQYCIHQSNKLEQVRGNVMKVAIVIAGICSQGLVNPPGGLWQQDFTNAISPYSCQAAFCAAGTSVLAASNPAAYKNFVFINTFTLFSSLSIMVSIVAGVPFQNKLFISMMVLSTHAIVALIAVSSLIFVSQITPRSVVDDIWGTAWKCVVALLSLIAAVTAVQVIRLLTKACRMHYGTRPRHILT